MPSYSEDYILRLINQLRKFLTEIVALRTAGRHDEATTALVHAQERLFARTWAEISPLSPDEQFAVLTRGELPSHARGKCLLQVEHLLEFGRIYWANDERAVAVGAWRFAHILLELTGQHFPENEDNAIARFESEVRELLLKSAA